MTRSKPRSKLVQMICNIGSEISKLSIFTLYHPILFVAKIGGTKPLRAVLLVQVTSLFEQLDSGSDRAAIEQGLLRKPCVENYTEFHQVIPAIT